MEPANEFEGLIQSAPGLLSANEASRIAPELYSRIHSLVQQLDGVDPYIIASVRAIVHRSS